MGYDYTTWATVSDVVELLYAIPDLVPTASEDLANIMAEPTRLAVAREIEKDTGRRFDLTRDVDGNPVDETRYFDGSGTGIQEVDAMVSLTSVGVIGAAGSDAQTLSNVYLESEAELPYTRIAIYQGTGQWYGATYAERFPVGRKNISVTGVWGYASTIPADLWLAHLQETAARVSATLLFKPAGRVKRFTVADAISEEKTFELPGVAAGWHPYFLDRKRIYTDPRRCHVRIVRPRMV